MFVCISLHFYVFFREKRDIRDSKMKRFPCYDYGAMARAGDGQIEIALRMPDGSQIKGVYRSIGHLFGNHYVVL